MITKSVVKEVIHAFESFLRDDLNYPETKAVKNNYPIFREIKDDKYVLLMLQILTNLARRDLNDKIYKICNLIDGAFCGRDKELDFNIIHEIIDTL